MTLTNTLVYAFIERENAIKRSLITVVVVPLGRSWLGIPFDKDVYRSQ